MHAGSVQREPNLNPAVTTIVSVLTFHGIYDQSGSPVAACIVEQSAVQFLHIYAHIVVRVFAHILTSQLIWRIVFEEVTSCVSLDAFCI